MKIFKSCVILLCISIFTIGCVTLNIKQKENYFDKIIPPGTVQINDTFYCDIAEVGNLYYLEYMFWVKKIFGDSSVEFRSILPNTMVWLNCDSCLQSNTIYYLRHPVYRDYPIVGISQQQALDYCKWRSDRVFEYILVCYSVFNYFPHQNKDTVFTIENYFNGNYMGIKPDTHLMYYPEYSLPDLIERNLVLKYQDSMDYSIAHKHYLPGRKPKIDSIYCQIIPCKNDTTILCEPMRGYYYKKMTKRSLINLRGNVTEWGNIENLTFGGGWKNTQDEIQKQDTFYYPNANVNTGFRCVCKWRKWED